MGKRFTEEEMEVLRQHPAVRSVNTYTLQFTPEFKMWFYREHQSGKSTPRILTDAGFDLSMLGKRRVQSIRVHIVRWFESDHAACLEKDSRSISVSTYELAAANEKIDRLERQLKHTTQELEFVKK